MIWLLYYKGNKKLKCTPICCVTFLALKHILYDKCDNVKH